MNYHKIYSRLVNNKSHRVKGKEIYYESHHIVPRSLGGSNDASNLVLLTAKEHFIAHLLLTKMYEGVEKKKMIYAFWMMCNMKRHCVSANQYNKYKLIASENRKGFRFSEESRRKMSNSKKGKIGNRLNSKASIETLKKMSDVMIGNIPWNKNKKTKGIQSHNEKIVFQIDKETNEIIKEWSSISEASKELNISIASISYVCTDTIGRYKTAKGFIWKFKNK